MSKDIGKFLDNKDFLTNKTIVVGVSTGVDSMTLLDLLIKKSAIYHFSIVIAHVNHGKRSQSVEEEEFIRNFAQCHNYPIEVLKLAKEDFVDENFQAKARKMRYAFFFKTMDKYHADYLALAHHGIDNMETILMRILRGSSIKGYSGMSIVSQYQKYTIIRPLLNDLKEDIYKYAVANKIKYYEDVSNTSDIYTRNRLRSKVIPTIFEESNNAHLKFNEFSNKIGEAVDFIDGYRNDFIKKYVEYKNDYFILTLPEFKKEKAFMQREILFELLKPYNLSEENIKEIEKVIDSNKPNVIFDIKGQYTIAKEYDQLMVFNYLYEPQKIYLTIEKEGKYHLRDNMYLTVVKKKNNISTNKYEMCYNIDKLPLIIRTKEDGDRIKLNNGYKKVKDLLIDLKIGAIERKNVLLVCDSKGEVLSVLGYAKSVVLRQLKDNNIILQLGEE